MTDFKVIEHHEINTFEKIIKKLMKEGWEPLGGTTVYAIQLPEGTLHMLCQAMGK